MKDNGSVRGDELLRKWLCGDINCEEELELFEIAASDAMVGEALEGFIGQGIIERARLPEAVIAQLYPGEGTRRAAKLKSIVWLRSVAAALAFIVALGLLITLSRNTGTVAEPVAVDLVDNAGAGEIWTTAGTAAATPAGPDGAGAEATSPPDQKLQKQVGATGDGDRTALAAEERSAPSEAVSHAVSYEPAIAEAGIATDIELEREESLLPDGIPGLPAEAGPGTQSPQNAADPGTQMAENAGEGQEEVIALQFFDYEADDILKREVQMEAIREGDQPITGYEIDIRSGVSPESLAGTVGEDGPVPGDIDQVALQSRSDLADAAATGQPEVPANRIASNVVITEYKIQKRDITNPPVEDYNSLVREKYKKKARPEVGFYQYKKYLKQAASCLIDEYVNADYLEEAVIKFRVYNSGDIEFLELFGTEQSSCADNISAQITSGPKWEVQEHYESIDIEVPFKVLYPYMY